MGERNKLIDMTGRRFGRLVVLRRGPNNKRGEVQWLARCDCGGEKNARGAALRFGDMRSCGCLRHEGHGQSRTPAYQAWTSLRYRCNNEKSRSYPDYGGRGIKVCDRWRSFKAFFEDMGECPKGMSIDRVNNDGDYEPNNCRWATVEEQVHNKRNNRWITANGQTKILADWGRVLGCHPRVISNRLQRGWSETEAVLTPAGAKRKS